MQHLIKNDLICCINEQQRHITMGEEKDLHQEEIKQENKIPESNEKKNEDVKKVEIPELNYSEATRKALIERLALLISTQSPLNIKSEIDTIKSVFYLKLAKEVAELKTKFLADKEMKEEDFKAPKDELESILKSELAKYKQLKNNAYTQQEKEREENLKKKEALIEELKELIEKEESIKETFDAFHAIQDKWHSVGSVPATANNDLWQNYYLQVEHFYDYIKINKDLRDLDFRRNQEKKESLCEKAEKLAEYSSPVEAFKILQVYHQEWKETGPVSKELREPLWERFKTATSAVNKRHQDHFLELKEKQIENLKKKEALCEKVEAIANADNDKIKDWNKNTKLIQEIQEEWRTIGIVPKQDNGPIYHRFRKGCDLFFKNKRLFFKEQQGEQNENLEKKKELLEKAIALKESEDWNGTTDTLIGIQKEWKKIGPVPRKHSEQIWQQFREACDTFFERKKNFLGSSNEQQEENLATKQALIEKIKVFTSSDNPQEDVKQLLAFKEEWLNIGHVPIKDKNKINSEYHNELNAQFDKLNLKKEDREMEKFRSKLDDITDSDDRLYSERRKLSQQLKDLESEIGTFENNIGFLSNSKSSEKLVKEYSTRIEKAKAQCLLLKKKIRMIDSID